MKTLLSGLLSVLLLSSCGSTMEVFTDQDKDHNPANYSSYNWQSLAAIENKANNPLYYNELNDKRIREAVNKELQSRNYAMQEQNGALEIHYHILVEDKTGSVTESNNSLQHPLSNLQRVNTFQYRQGTLIIDVMDSKTNTLIWRGWATDIVGNEARKNPEKAIQQAVKKIFRSFPSR